MSSIEKVCPKCGQPHTKAGQFCSRACANSRSRPFELRQRVSSALKGRKGHPVSEETRQKLSKQMLGNSRRPKIRISKVCPSCGITFEARPDRVYCSNDCRKLQSGGFREGSVKNHLHGIYEGYRYDSSWELIWIKWALQQGVVFVRNTEGFEYLFEGEAHRYYPDFYLPAEDRYVEIKGIQDDLWEAKRQAFPYPLQVLGKKEIREIQGSLV